MALSFPRDCGDASAPAAGDRATCGAPGVVRARHRPRRARNRACPRARERAADRIEAARRLFPSLWFNEATTQGGLDALGWYHEKKDEARDIGRGPEHDWSSHGADACGLAWVCADEIRKEQNRVIQDPYKAFRRG